MGMIHGGNGVVASGSVSGVTMTSAMDVSGTLGRCLLYLGLALIVLTAIFAAAAVRGLLPRGGRKP
jgi:hypothetical protein